MGTQPTKVGSPTKGTDKPVPTHLHRVSKSKRNFYFKKKGEEKGEYLKFKLWAPQL